MTLQLVYETHSLTTDNEMGAATGWLPGQLSERGRRLAAELGARRRDDGIAAVYVSDLQRALQTTEIAFGGTSLPVIPDPRLRECNYGELNGMPTRQLQDERVRHVDEAWPGGGESYRQVVARTGELLGELLANWDGSRILLVGHSANKWALDHLLLGRDLTDLVAADFAWQEGWEYVVGGDWDAHPTGQ